MVPTIDRSYLLNQRALPTIYGGAVLIAAGRYSFSYHFGVYFCVDSAGWHKSDSEIDSSTASLDLATAVRLQSFWKVGSKATLTRN
jgi:hypothetical protein